MEFLDLLNDNLSWHNRKRWESTIQLMDVLFSTYKKDLIQVSEKAGKVRRKNGLMISDLQ